MFDRGELDDHVRLNPGIFPSQMEISGGMGMVEPEAFGSIAEGLAKDHPTDAQIRGVLGENGLRIAAQVSR